jgi:predicted nucleic acid-binding protein
MRVAIDTNVLAYAEGINGQPMKSAALTLVAKLPNSTTVIPVQVLGELYRLLVRKDGRSEQRARADVLSWQDTFGVIETSETVLTLALDLSIHQRFGIWDSVALSAAATAGCRLFLSEDLQDGFVWNGVTVVNPFAKVQHPLLAALLS